MQNKHFRHFRWRPALIFVVIGTAVIMFLLVRKGESQAFSPYSDFQAMSLAQLSTLQVKLTYLGPQRGPISSLAFTSSSNTLNLSLFLPFRRSGINYSNDDLPSIRSFSASQQELKAVIDNVGTLPNVTAGGVAAEPYFSFALLNSQPSTKAFEAVLNKSDSASLFAQLRLSLVNNREGLRKVSDLACPLDLLEPARPTDVSANVKVTLSGVRLNRSTGRYVGTATVMNTSAAALATPISIVFLPAKNIGLANADGTTCGTTPVGAPFINLSSSLGPGQSTAVTLEFDNPDRDQIMVTTKALAGPGAR